MKKPGDARSQLILFGGAFDPPHEGHQLCIDSVLHAIPLGQVLVMPTPTPPPSDPNLPAKTTVAGYADRLAMCERAFQDDPRVKVSPLESQLPAPQYTYRTLETLRDLPAYGPDVPLALVVGEDQFWGLSFWKSPALLVSMAQIIVMARPDGTPGHSAHRTPLTPRSALLHVEGILEGTPPKSLTLAGPPIVLGQKTSAASSSAIRKKILAGEPIPADWLRNSVMEYIHDHNIYGVH